MTRRETQNEFVKAVALLILYVYEKGYKLSFGDALAKTGHKENSLHYAGLAIDLNLFKGDTYLTRTEDHEELGKFWESLHPNCRWGGNFSRRDGNHYEMLQDK